MIVPSLYPVFNPANIDIQGNTGQIECKEENPSLSAINLYIIQ